ncbi:unnamed protein product, partial [Allacma fusca]
FAVLKNKRIKYPFIKLLWCTSCPGPEIF